MVDISRVNKIDLLEELWKNSKPLNLYLYNDKEEVIFSDIEATSAVLSYIYYFQGRSIRCNLSGKTSVSKYYNKKVGKNAFENIVINLISTTTK